VPEPVAEAVRTGDLVVAAVLSGNRNFEGRINPIVRANYLASPPLVVAYALAGTMDFDPEADPLGMDRDGKPVHLRDVWPTPGEIRDAMRSVDAKLFREEYAPRDRGRRALARDAGAARRALRLGADVHLHQVAAVLRRHAPHGAGGDRRARRARPRAPRRQRDDGPHLARGLDPEGQPGGRYLIGHGVEPTDFNSYGARRGNHEVMVRGTFANIRLRNQLVPGVEGGWTVHLPTASA
jgi:aconitate hydratase